MDVRKSISMIENRFKSWACNSVQRKTRTSGETTKRGMVSGEWWSFLAKFKRYQSNILIYRCDCGAVQTSVLSLNMCVYNAHFINLEMEWSLSPLLFSPLLSSPFLSFIVCSSSSPSNYNPILSHFTVLPKLFCVKQQTQQQQLPQTPQYQ